MAYQIQVCPKMQLMINLNNRCKYKYANNYTGSSYLRKLVNSKMYWHLFYMFDSQLLFIWIYSASYSPEFSVILELLRKPGPLLLNELFWLDITKTSLDFSSSMWFSFVFFFPLFKSQEWLVLLTSFRGFPLIFLRFWIKQRKYVTIHYVKCYIKLFN